MVLAVTIINTGPLTVSGIPDFAIVLRDLAVVEAPGRRLRLVRLWSLFNKMTRDEQTSHAVSTHCHARDAWAVIHMYAHTNHRRASRKANQTLQYDLISVRLNVYLLEHTHNCAC